MFRKVSNYVQNTLTEKMNEIAAKVDYANFLFPIITVKAHSVNFTLLFDTPLFPAYFF